MLTQQEAIEILKQKTAMLGEITALCVKYTDNFQDYIFMIADSGHVVVINVELHAALGVKLSKTGNVRLFGAQNNHADSLVQQLGVLLADDNKAFTCRRMFV